MLVLALFEFSFGLFSKPDFFLPRIITIPLDRYDTSSSRHFPARKICYQYQDLHQEELALSDDDWHLRLKGIPVGGLSGPLRIHTDIDGDPLPPTPLNHRPHHDLSEGFITKAHFDELTLSCVAIDFRDKMKRMPFYDPCPEGLILKHRSCVTPDGSPSFLVPNLLKCPVYYYPTQIQNQCLRAEFYERKMSPQCPNGYKLKKDFNYELQEKSLHCEKKTIEAPISYEEVDDGYLVTCDVGQEMSPKGECIKLDIKDPSFTGGKHKGWHSTQVVEDGVSVGYDLTKFEITKPTLTCKQRHRLTESRLLNSGILVRDAEMGGRLGAAPSLGNSSFLTSNNFRRRLGAIYDVDVNGVPQTEQDALKRMLQDSVRDLSDYQASVDLEACGVSEIPADNPRCPKGYQLTGSSGHQFCRPQYHFPFTWNCDHISGSEMIAFDDIVEDADFTGVFRTGYHVMGHYCRLQGNQDVLVGPSLNSKRQEKVVKTLKRYEAKAAAKGYENDTEAHH